MQLSQGRYTLCEEISRSRRHSVHTALDTVEDRRVVIKMVDPGLCPEPELAEEIALLRREAGILAGLKHPGVMPLEKIGVDAGGVYLVMPLLEGHTLEEEIGAQGALGFSPAAAIALQVARTLAHVHAARILHLDIKPANIFLAHGAPGEPPAALLMDFGLSRLRCLIERECPSELVGSAAYMSPEQTGILGQPVTPRSDLYSLGITLYRMLTGRLPFDAEDLSTLLHRQVAAEPARPSTLAPSLPPVLDEIVLTLLRKDPGERYLTAEALCEDLAHFLRMAAGGKASSVFPVRRSRTHGALNLSPAIRGRERLLREFAGALNAFPASEKRVVLISGEPGSGKTRLAQEYLKRCLGSDLLLASGQCLHWNRDKPGQVLLELLEAFSGTVDQYPAPRRAQFLRGMGGPAPEGGAFSAVIADLRRAWGELTYLTHGDPRSIQNEIFARLAGSLESIAAMSEGIVIFVDDVHWCDDVTLYFLEYLAHRTARAPLLLIGSYCPERVDPGGECGRFLSSLRGGSLLEQRLQPLAPEECRELVADVLCASPGEVPREIPETVYRVTKGNPLFLLEYLKWGVEAGLFSFRDAAWGIEEEKAASALLPGTLAETLATRIALLTPQTRAVLQCASVLGQQFSRNVLSDLAALRPEDLLPLIQEAIELQLVLERSALEGGGYLFAHQQIFDAVYRSIPPEDRRRLHEAAGAALEARNLSSPERVAFELSTHFYLGYSQQKAFHYLMMAAALARSRSALREMAFYLERAKTLFPGHRTEKDASVWLNINRALGETYLRLGDYDKAIVDFQEAHRSSSGRRQRAVLQSYIGSVMFRKGNFLDSLRCHEEALSEYGWSPPSNRFTVAAAVAVQLCIRAGRAFLPRRFRRALRRAGDPALPERIRLFSQASYAYFFLGDLGRALWTNLAQLNSAEILGRSEHLAQACNMHGLILSHIGFFRRAEKFIERSRVINEGLVARAWGIAQCQSYLGFCLMNQGRVREAIPTLVRAVEIWRGVGDALELGYALRYLAWSYCYIGDLRKAMTTFDELMELHRGTQDIWGLASAWNGKAWVALMQGEFDIALDCCRNSLAFSSASPELATPRAIARKICASVHYAAGNLRRAEMELEESRLLIERHRLVSPAHSITYAQLAEVYCAIDTREAPLSAWERRRIRSLCQRGRIQAGRIKRYHAEVHRSLALYHARFGRERRACALFERAVAIFQAQGYAYELARTYRLYGEFLHARGNPRAPGFLQRALNLYTDIGAGHEMQEIRLLLGLHPSPESRRETEGRGASAGSLADAGALETVLDLSRRVSRILDLDELLVHILDCALQAAGAERGFLLLRDGGQFRIKVARDHNRNTLDAEGAEISRGIVDRVAETGVPLLIADALEHEEWKARESVRLHGLRSVACIPMLDEGVVRGIIYVENRSTRGLFSERHRNLLGLFAAHAAVALKNAELYARVREAERTAQEENLRLKRDFTFQHRPEGIVGEDPSLRAVLGQVAQIAPTDLSVLIQGETGTGKGMVARAVHAASLRSDRIFVAQNCTNLPEMLLESELFGHAKGAFTGATHDKKGLLEIANGGTLFLDEIAEASPSIQAKLLQVIEGQSFRRLGDNAERRVDVRIIAATNRNLAGEVAEKRFRADLYYRLNGMTVSLPPLRERGKDIPLLASYFASAVAKELGKRIAGITARAMDALAAYPFPGNVRELENEIRRAVVLCETEGPIDFEDLSPAVRAGDRRDTGGGERLPREYLNRPIKEAVRLFEERLIRETMCRSGGNASSAARTLGISRSGLYNKLGKAPRDKEQTEA